MCVDVCVDVSAELLSVLTALYSLDPLFSVTLCDSSVRSERNLSGHTATFSDLAIAVAMLIAQVLVAAVGKLRQRRVGVQQLRPRIHVRRLLLPTKMGGRE